MSIKKYKLEINYAIHPGVTLREKLEELQIKPKEIVNDNCSRKK